MGPLGHQYEIKGLLALFPAKRPCPPSERLMGQVFQCSILGVDQPLTPYLSTTCGNPQLSASACYRTSWVWGPWDNLCIITLPSPSNKCSVYRRALRAKSFPSGLAASLRNREGRYGPGRGPFSGESFKCPAFLATIVVGGIERKAT